MARTVLFVDRDCGDRRPFRLSRDKDVQARRRWWLGLFNRGQQITPRVYLARHARDGGRRVPIGPGADGAAFDPETGYALSTNGGDGTLTVVHEDAPDKYSVVENVPTLRRARTIALDNTTHSVYTVTAEFGQAPAPTTEQPRPRPPMVPGSFTLLVVSR